MAQSLRLEEPAPGVVRLVLAQPPANALGPDMRAALDAALADALARPDLGALLLAGEGTFSLGLPPVGQGAQQQGPSLAGICDRLDAATVPVVALLQGMAMGGGAELAIAAHYRIALRSAMIGLPDVKLGLPPAAGTTQRLPRIIGPDLALQMLLSGQSLSADKACRAGLVDAVVDDDLPAAGLRLVRELRDVRAGPRPAPDRAVPGFGALQAAVARARATLAPDYPVRAPRRIVDCVEMVAVLPYRAGLDYEAAAFEDCAGTEAAAALRCTVLAERRAQKRSQRWMAQAHRPDQVGIWGDGAAAAGLAAGILAAGPAVRLATRDEAGLTRAVAAVDRVLDAATAAQRLTADQRAALWARFSGGVGGASLAGTALVFEAGTGPWAGRARDLATLSAALEPGATLVATGALASGPALARATHRPARTVWLHLPELVPGGNLAEVIATPATAPDTVATVAALARRMNRMPLPAREESPLLAVLMAALEVADTLVEDGVSPYAVDAAFCDWGAGAGPFRIADRLGLETVLALRARQIGPDDPVGRGLLVPGQLVAGGRPGRLGGRGYYSYPDSAPAGQPDPAVEAIVASAREVLERTPCQIGADQIRARLLAGMAQAGAGLLRRGVVGRADEIDLALVHGVGVARRRAGPMHAADAVGLLALRRTLLDMAEAPGRAAIWTPDPLIADLIRAGRRFADFRARTGGAVSPA